MSRKARDERTLRHVASLRRAERAPEVADEIRAVRRDLERELGPTVPRSVAARLLGVSQTALDRWTSAGDIPTVITPTSRREVPRRFVIELMAAVDAFRRAGSGRPLAAALRQRRESDLAAVDTVVENLGDGTHHGHAGADLRSLARHRIIAERLDAQLVGEARERLDELVDQELIHPVYERRWRELLDRPRDEIARVITADTQEGRDLRQNSPFRGGMTEPERRRILELVGQA